MNRNLLTPFRAAALAGALAAAAGLALAGGERGAEFPISVAEATQRADARFQAMDSDGNGEISAAEFAAAPRPDTWGHRGERGRPFHHWRGDRDGGERPASDAALFDRLDGNADGLLSRDEFTAERLRDARRAAVQEHVFERLDADGSGALSRDELPDMSARLADMDADGDGMVTREEARAHHPRFHRDGDRG